MIGVIAIREEIGEPDSGRCLRYYWEMQVSCHLLDDAPARAHLESRLFDHLLRGFDAEMPASLEADVVGPIVIDHARARDIAEHFGAVVGDINLATVDFDKNWPEYRVVMAIGAHSPAGVFEVGG